LSPALAWAYPSIDAISTHLFDSSDPAPVGRVSDTGRRRESGNGSREPIAVIGIGCRFPMAAGPEEFWQLLAAGTDAMRPVPAERWDAGSVARLAGTVGGRIPDQAGFLDVPVDEFDPLFFGISPREAQQMDPQQRVFLEVAWEALEDAGVAPSALEGSRTGVFAGVIWHDYADLGGGRLDRLSAHSATGRALNMVANRLSYALGLRGPSLAVDSACSSSLLAIHLACLSLWSGESSMALAGGVNLLLSPETMVSLTAFGGLAPDGRCKAFDARADGFGRGEGCGVVVLKPLSRALADGDDICCTIRGSATNNDGLSNGLTAPNPLAQEEVLRAACERAGVAPGEVHYVETHGTGTALGDPIEAAALAAVYGVDRAPDAPLVLGSVKTNLGHLEGASGIAGFVKAALCLRHREIPPNLHFETPNQHIDFDGLRLRVPRAVEPWPADRAPLAGVSSFGWGGTNVHLVLEGWREPDEVFPAAADPADAGPRPKTVFVCSPHGHHWLGMGRTLLRTEPVFRTALERCDAELSRHTGWSLIDELYADEADTRWDDVSVTQPVLFAIQYAIAEWMVAAGVRPDAVVGHSLGEITAAVIAGILDLPDAVRLVYHYSRQQQRIGDQGGGMAIVQLSADDLENVVGGHPEVVVAGYNGPRSTVLAGPVTALESIVAELKARDALCALIRVNLAAHSPAIDVIMDDLEQAIQGITPRPGRIPMLSTVTGQPLAWQEAGPRYFVRNLREPVRLAAAMDALLADGYRVFLEISAHPVLAPSLEQSVEDSGLDDGVVLGTMRRADDERQGLVELLDALNKLGVRCQRPGTPADGASELFTLSAKAPQALTEFAERVAGAIETGAVLADLSQAARLRPDHPYRLAVVARDGADLAEQLRARAVETGGHRPADPKSKVAFVFPGQGSQWIGMGQQLLAREPVFHTAIRECDAAARAYLDWSILAELQADEETSRLDRIDVVQPVLFSIQVALARLWRSWGVEPSAVIGHSMGEVAAAQVAGALSLDAAARIICRRSSLMRRASGQGAMLAVECTLADADRYIEPYRDRVSVAVNNSPRSTVLSGDRTALEHIARQLEQADTFCRWVKVDVASHSPQMDALRTDLLDALDGIGSQRGTVPIYSTVTGDVLDGAGLDAGYWMDNLRQPVLFAHQVQRLLGEDVRVFLEMSPHPILLPAVEQVAMHVEVDAVVVPSLRRREAERGILLGSLGELYVRGVPVDIARAATPGRRGVRLPSYPWQRERFWLDADEPGTSRPVRARAGALLGERFDSPIEPGTHYWQMDVDPATAAAGDHEIGGTVLLPGAVHVELALAAAHEVRPGDPVAVTGLRFLDPLVLPAGGRRVQVVLTESGSRSVVRVFAPRPTGVIAVADAELEPLGLAGPGLPVDVDGLDGRMTERLDGAEYYRRLAGRGLRYGPAYQGIEYLARADGEALARLSVPPTVRGASYHVHPSLLDAALQVVLAPLLGPEWGARHTTAYLSEGIGRVTVWRRRDDECWAYASVRDHDQDERAHLADVRVTSLDGEPVLEAIGVTIRRLDHLPRFAEQTSGPDTGGADGSRSEGPTVASDRDSLLALEPGSRRAAVDAMVAESVAKVVRLPAARIDVNIPVRALGIDSVMSLELRNHLEARFGVRLSATAIWNYPTVRDLAGFLAGKMAVPLDGGPPDRPVVPAPRSTEPAPVPDVGIAADDLLMRELAELTERIEGI